MVLKLLLPLISFLIFTNIAVGLDEDAVIFQQYPQDVVKLQQFDNNDDIYMIFPYGGGYYSHNYAKYNFFRPVVFVQNSYSSVINNSNSGETTYVSPDEYSFIKNN